MDLAKARRHVFAHHHFGLLQSSRRRQVLPAVGAQVIAAQHHAVVRQAYCGSNRKHTLAEIRGPHSGVTAILVHLVRCGLDQGSAPCVLREAQCRLQHQRMRGAYGIDPHRIAGLVAANQIQHRIHTGCSTSLSSGSIASSAAARKASTMATIVTMLGMTANTTMETIAVIIGAPALASGATTRARP